MMALANKIQKKVANLFTSRHVVYGIPLVWLLIFFLVPLLVVLKISFSEALRAQPPYAPLFDLAEQGVVNIRLIFDNYVFLFEDSLYFKSYLTSVIIAAIATLLCLLIGYPMAYYISRCSPNKRNILLLLVILPFWTSFLLRIYAWIGILKTDGVINNILMTIGIIDSPLTMMYTNGAAFIGIVYSYLPFMILPLYAILEKLDTSLIEASSDLGCPPWKSFIHITIPLSWPGILSGCLLVFIPAVGEYIIPTLLGDQQNAMIGRVLYDEFFQNNDWPIASSVAVVMLLLLVVPIMLFRHSQKLEAS